MKKVAVGCLVIVAVLAVLGGVATYWVYRKVATTVSQFAEVASVPDLERTVRNTAAFTPPASGELSKDQVERLARVQQAVRQRLGERFSALQKQYKELMDKPEATALDVPQLVSAYRDVAAAWMDAKRAQVEALNAERFSIEEYRWVRNQVYMAVGIPYVDIDVARIVEDIRQGVTSPATPPLKGSVGPSGPDANQVLVAPLKKSFEDNVALVVFGL